MFLWFTANALTDVCMRLTFSFSFAYRQIYTYMRDSSPFIAYGWHRVSAQKIYSKGSRSISFTPSFSLVYFCLSLISVCLFWCDFLSQCDVSRMWWSTSDFWSFPRGMYLSLSRVPLPMSTSSEAHRVYQYLSHLAARQKWLGNKRMNQHRRHSNSGLPCCQEASRVAHGTMSWKEFQASHTCLLLRILCLFFPRKATGREQINKAFVCSRKNVWEALNFGGVCSSCCKDVSPGYL